MNHHYPVRTNASLLQLILIFAWVAGIAYAGDSYGALGAWMVGLGVPVVLGVIAFVPHTTQTK